MERVRKRDKENESIYVRYCTGPLLVVGSFHLWLPLGSDEVCACSCWVDMKPA